MLNHISRLALFEENSLKILKEILLSNKEYVDSEYLAKKAGVSGVKLGTFLGALSKSKVSYVSRFAKKSMRVERVRRGVKVFISFPIQVYRVNQEVLENRKEILERIDAILKVLGEI